MRLATLAPSGWDARIAFPVQSVGFAEAASQNGLHSDHHERVDAQQRTAPAFRSSFLG